MTQFTDKREDEEADKQYWISREKFFNELDTKRKKENIRYEKYLKKLNKKHG